MHFWIDKPAGQCYGFSGRRYPTMSFPKPHFAGQHRRCGNLEVARLQMVTPVHRFQAMNNSGNSAGPSNLSSIRSIISTTQNSNVTGQEINNVLNTTVNQQIPSQSISAVNRGLLNFSELNDAEMAGYRLRCSVWIIFVLATGFIAAAKFYFDHQQGADLEILVFCGLLVILLMSGCFYSIICRRSQNDHHQEIQAQPVTTVTVTNTISNNSTRQVSMPVRLNPPPPYHIAILIPPPELLEEAPPPAYDKIVH